MNYAPAKDFFTGIALDYTRTAIKNALLEDGSDFTTNAIFSSTDTLSAKIVAKESSLVAGLPLIALILEETKKLEQGDVQVTYLVNDGDKVNQGQTIAHFEGSSRILLRAERIMLNFICHLSGIANTTALFVKALEGTGVKLLDTRKTLPGLRFPEKYAVLVGGGLNHRVNLEELLLLKDNHIDAAGGITPAVEQLRKAHPALPIEVECATFAQVSEAVAMRVERIMLDNMPLDDLPQALSLVPAGIEVEVSGNVTCEKIRPIALQGNSRHITYISVGKLTHSAQYADFSMRISLPQSF